MSECMMFPKNWEKFVENYSFKDKEEVYTNGTVLVPVFRVEQMVEHYFSRKWIPVSERLPELETYIYSVDVLFCDVERNIYVGYVNFETGMWKDRHSATHLSKERVTHWMPLPEVPNGQT